MISGEVNSAYYWGEVKIHLPRNKHENRLCCFPSVLDTSTSPFTTPRSDWKANRRADRRLHAKLTRSLTKSCCEDIEGGANDNIVEGESPVQKARRFAQEVNFKILQKEANNGPPETGGKMGHGTGVRTHLSTFGNYGIVLQPQGDPV